MAIIYPYSLSLLNDLLRIEEVTWDIHRNDELSGSSDARVWQAEMSDPLWTARVRLAADYHAGAKQIAALIRKLHGAQESFFLCDPLSPYPQSDPDGSILGASAVLVASIATDRNAISLKGLPAAYVLTLGDKFQIQFASDTQTYFGEIDETVAADGSGVTATFDVFPHVPPGIAADAAVILAKPAAKVFVMPGTHSPGSARGLITEGASLTVMERRR